jgi:cyclophilin family peptidyl-prolyl cis-trans isomerase
VDQSVPFDIATIVTSCLRPVNRWKPNHHSLTYGQDVGPPDMPGAIVIDSKVLQDSPAIKRRHCLRLCVDCTPMFTPSQAISSVRNGTQSFASWRIYGLASAGTLIALTSCGTPTPAPSPHLATIQSAVVCPAPPPHTPIADPLRHYASAPKSSLNGSLGYCAYIATTHGVISVRLRPEYAPKAVNNFVFLAKHGFYDGLAFDQVCPAATGLLCPAQAPVAIAGGPSASGTGGPGYSVSADPVIGKYLFGAVAMYSDSSSALGSAFMISKGDSQALPRKYDIFGQVTDGIGALVQVQKGDAILWVAIEATSPEP